MATQSQSAFQAGMMSGWKEIANYLGKGVRTVQRYERIAALPVRRTALGQVGSVFATKAELDGWINARPSRQPFEASQGRQVSALEALKRSISKQQHLCRVTKALSGELSRSVEILRASVRFHATRRCERNCQQLM